MLVRILSAGAVLSVTLLLAYHLGQLLRGVVNPVGEDVLIGVGCLFSVLTLWALASYIMGEPLE